jgi:4-alpha-glucanotransferase
VVVGEDLGTVPAGVRASMRRHGVLGTWVLQSAAKPRAARAVRPVPRHVVAGLGTHDMFPFAGFLRGDDIGVRVETGQLDREAALRATAARRRLVARLFALFSVRSASEAPAELLRAALAFLGASQAAFVLVSLDDLLVQTEPQNLPGTGAERGNWRRKTAGTMPEVERVIAEAVRGLRARQGGSCCSD